MKPAVKTIHSQPSWVIRSNEVELALTQLGGHMAPVTFYRSSAQPVQPYYISPWQDEKLKIDEPVLVPLRGDFFCMPFGGGSVKGETHRAHGEPAHAKWTLSGAESAAGRTCIELVMTTKVRPGKVTKRLGLVDGQNAIYCQHVLEGYSGSMPLAHHATLRMPEEQNVVNVALSPTRFAVTNPTSPGNPARGDYYTMAVGAKFKDLSSAPVIWGERKEADFSSLPQHKGFCNLFACCNRTDVFPAWTTATFTQEGFVWFSVKDPKVLPTTMFWSENHGRWTFPWNGRNNCLGLEDICCFLSEGLAASLRPNTLNKAGVPTAVKLSPKKPTTVNYIQGVVKVPRGFDRVKTIRFGEGEVEFVAASGKKAQAALNYEFLRTGQF